MHEAQWQDRQRQNDRHRGSAAARGYDSRWRRYSESYRRHHPLCVMECAAEGRVTASAVVDHIVAHRGDPRLFWDPANHQAGCKPCHDRKTARQDGGFGRDAHQL